MSASTIAKHNEANSNILNRPQDMLESVKIDSEMGSYSEKK